MRTCQHRNTTFSRDICPDPCGVMHTLCASCGAMMDDCANFMPAPVTPAERAAADELTALTEEMGLYDEPAGRKVCSSTQGTGAGCIKDFGHDGPHYTEVGRMQTTWANTLKTASGGGVHGQTTAKGPNRSETTAADASPELAQPTAEQTSAAYALVSGWGVEDGYGYLATLVARALAAERAAIHARYEAVAQQLDREASILAPLGTLRSAAVAESKSITAAYIRQVAVQ